MTLQEAISKFGAEAKLKLSNPSASGAPEDQLRAPLEGLIANLAELTGLPPGSVVAVGETSLADLKTRPDYAVTRRNALIGFIEQTVSKRRRIARNVISAHWLNFQC